MADKDKGLVALIGDDKELLSELEEMKAAAKAAGFKEGKAAGLAEKKSKKAPAKKQKEPPYKKPVCFGKYKSVFDKQKKQCRTCFYAQECKKK